jgi:hypothetical protein
MVGRSTRLYTTHEDAAVDDGPAGRVARTATCRRRRTCREAMGCEKTNVRAGGCERCKGRPCTVARRASRVTAVALTSGLVALQPDALTFSSSSFVCSS